MGPTHHVPFGLAQTKEVGQKDANRGYPFRYLRICWASVCVIVLLLRRPSLHRTQSK